MKLFAFTKYLSVLAFLSLLGVAAGQAIPAISTSTEGVLSNDPFTVGWEFQVDAEVLLTDLGRVRVTAQPFAASTVALYRLDNGAKLASVTIPANAPGESAGNFYIAHYASLSTPFTLSPGVSYLVAAEAIDGSAFVQDAPAVVASPIRYVAGRAADLGASLPATATDTTFPIVRNETGISYLGGTFKFTGQGGAGGLAISNLAERTVFQRNASGSASVPIAGTFGNGTITRVEARAIPTEGGLLVDWTVIDNSPSNGTFSGTLPVSGGRYRIEARALEGTTVRFTGGTNLIGVGEVFVVAGQSNAANFGDTLQNADDDRVSTVNLETNTWEKAADPMPNAGGGGGSPWPQLGDLIAAQENVPVAIIPVAQGGTRVDEWLPGGQLYVQQLQRAINFTRNNTGLRAVLWHQGESDAAAGTSSSAYRQSLETIIAQSRVDAGFALPWGVALASSDPGASASSAAAIITAQQSVIQADPFVFQGASTNDFGSLGFLYDGVHFNQQGLNEHAARWFAQISGILGGSNPITTTAVTPTGEGVFSVSAFSIGWEFTVNAVTTVNQLGRITPIGSALTADSAAAIYRLDTGAIVASASIAAGTPGESLSAFHQVHKAPLVAPAALTPGINYVVLIESLDGVGFYQDVPSTVASGINYVAGRATAEGENLPTTATSATLPITRNQTGVSYLGATFDFQAGSTPPPSQGGAAITPTAQGVFSNSPFSVGWQFSVRQTTDVTRVGRVTSNGDSLSADSPVTIYRLDTGAPVGTAVVSSAASGEPIGAGFNAHYVSLASPITLQPGIQYVILTEALDNAGFFQDVPATVSPNVNYISGRAGSPGASLPALANDATLPIFRNETGISYLGPIFDTGDASPPPPPVGGGNALTPTGQGILSGDSFSVGWEFMVTSPTTVGKLGRVTRAGGAPIANSPAAIYRLDTGAQIASATIPASASGESLGSGYEVRYTNLASPVALSPGISYVVLVEALDGAGFDQDVPATLAAGINYVAGRAADPGVALPATGTDLTLPIVRNVTGVSYLGAMFSIGEGNPPPIDTTPPSVALQGPATSSSAFTVQVTFSEPVIGLTLSDFTITNGIASALSGAGASYTFNVSPSSGGTTTVSLPSGLVADAAGNGNTLSNTLTVNVTLPPTDTTPPSITLSGPAVVQGSFSVQATFSESVNGLALADFAITNGTASNLNGSGSQYTINVAPQTVGPVAISLPSGRVTDAAGSGNTASSTLTVNFQLPPVDNGCDSEVGLRSRTTNNPLKFRVQNDSNTTLRIYWIDYSGNRVNYGTVLPGAKFKVDSFGDHPWVITDNASGDCLKLVGKALDEPYVQIGSRQGLPWLENFNGLTNGATHDDDATAWTATRSANIGVLNNEFRIHSSGGEGLWISETVQINDAASVSVSVDLQAEGQLETQDFVQVIAVVDGVETVVASRQGLFNQGNVERVERRGLTGQSIQIIVRALTTGTSEVFYWDNIRIIDETAPILELEAEDGNLVGMVIGNHSSASGGAYMHFPNSGRIENSPNPNFRAEYAFQVAQSGLYRIKGWVYAPNGDDDSFFVRVDGQPAAGYLWDTRPNTQYLEDYVNDRSGADPVEVQLSAGTHVVTVYLREDGTRLDKLALELLQPTSPPGVVDTLGDVAFPSTVLSPSTINLDIPYETTVRRAIQIRLHDADNGFTTIGQVDTVAEAGTGIISVEIPVNSNARTGSGYLWVLRLLPVDWTSVDQALDAQYTDATVQRNTGGAATQNKLGIVTLPSTAQPTETVTLTIDYEAKTRLSLGVWLHDVNNSFRTVGFAQAIVEPGIGTKEFNIGIAGDARIGQGYIWAVRLLPEGATDASAALDAYYLEATIQQSVNNLVNYAVLPTASARQSSEFAPAYDASVARDGNTDGDWRNRSVTHTRLDTNAWWEVDLGAVKNIDYVLVWNRTDCCGDRLSPYYVLVSDVPFVSNGLDASRNQSGVSSYHFTNTPSPTQRVEVNRSGRYVRIQLAGAGYLSLAEVEVYGANEGLVNGVRFEYYEREWLQLPNFDALSPLRTGTLLNFDLSPRDQNDYFAFRYRCCLRIDQEGTYRFYTNSDDGSKLFLDGALVVNNDGIHNAEERSGTRFLTVGMHPMELQFFHRVGAETLQVSWAGPGFAKQSIPTSVLTLNETGISPGFHHVGRQVTASDNADGDLFDLTAEYALGLDPAQAFMSNLGLHVETNGDQIDVWYDRPSRLSEIDYTLEYSNDAKTWIDVLGPTISSASYGMDHVRYEQLTSLDEVTTEKGFVRLRIRHNDWNHETTTPICGWYQTELHAGYQTHGLTLNREAVFASTIAYTTSDSLVAESDGLLEVLNEGRAYYAEITSGLYEGHRIDVRVGDSGELTVTLDLTAAHNTLTSLPEEGLLGEHFVIRPHWTLGEAYDKSLFQGSNDPASADQVLFFDGQSYDGFFLLEGGAFHHWTSLSDSSLASADNTIIPPGVGNFVKRPEGQASMPLIVSGHLRQSAFIQPLHLGYNLVSSSRPVSESPAERGLLTNNGFLGGLEPSGADQIQIWLGDQTIGVQGYASYFLLDAPEQGRSHWTPTDDARLTNANDAPLFSGDRALFIRAASESHEAYRIPAMRSE